MIEDSVIASTECDVGCKDRCDFWGVLIRQVWFIFFKSAFCEFYIAFLLGYYLYMF